MRDEQRFFALQNGIRDACRRDVHRLQFGRVPFGRKVTDTGPIPGSDDTMVWLDEKIAIVFVNQCRVTEVDLLVSESGTGVIDHVISLSKTDFN